MIVLVRYCAISAHTPAPFSAITIPTTAETSVPMIVEKKNRLKSILREIYAVWIDWKEEIGRRIAKTRIACFNNGILYAVARNGAATKRIA